MAGSGLPLNLHLQQLRYLVEVERGPTLSAAASRLHVSQPALSQSLAEMERRLGVALFERRGHGRVLTSEGRELTAFARRVLGDAREVGDRLSRGREGEGGELRVGMIDAASLYVLPQAVRGFREAHPGVTLRLEVAASGQLLGRLREHALDLVFITGPLDERDVVSEAIHEEPLYLYAPPRFRGRLEDLDWVLYPQGSRTRGAIDAGLLERGIVPRVMLESGNPQVLRQMVVLGLGASVLPAAVAEGGEPRLRRRRGGAIANRSLLAVRRRSTAADPRVTAFVETAKARGRR